MNNKINMETRANEILNIQRDAVNTIKINSEILSAIEKIIEIKQKNGRIITTGMGKAGIIAYKMSATLASIGFPSFFINPAEAAHGDVGRIAPEDVVITFSNSGSTSEVVNMIKTLHGLNNNRNYIITIGSNKNPQIPTNLAISYGDVAESCVVSKVPSTSTTIMLIIADIIAITAAEMIGLNDQWFKARHPGGAIGVSYQKEEKK